MSILFYAKSAKVAKNGLLPIYLRITINGARIELSTSRFVEKTKWNAEACKMKGSSEEARLINTHLDTLRTKVYETENWMINNNQEINSQFKELITSKTLKYFFIIFEMGIVLFGDIKILKFSILNNI
ncbi:Arm DNA-binding domain-containing protein [Flavobacterium cucumis]|nr:Arm DNA-binding domain-containing protein [Flavobacterium cucumis]